MIKIMKYKKEVSVIITVLLIFGVYGLYNYNINNALSYVDVPVAKNYIGSGSQITIDDIEYVKIPKVAILENIIDSDQEAVGKYIQSYSALAKGSYFYDDLLVAPDDLKDSSLFNLKENEVAISIDVDVKTSYANAIKSGHFIDVYFQGYTANSGQDRKVVYGPLVYSARVIGVKDAGGLNVENDVKQTSAILVLALDYEEADLVQRAKFFGDVMPIISYDTLNQSDTNYYDIGKMKDIIHQKSLDVVLAKGN